MLDHFALGGSRDWSAEFLKLYSNIRAGGEKQVRDFEAKRVLNTKPSLPMNDYTGTYTDPLYGTVVITLEGDELVVEANKFVKARFSHWHYDTFRGWYDKKWYGKSNLSFAIGSNGKINTVTFDGTDFAREK
jgi:hypothetical protein